MLLVPFTNGIMVSELPYHIRLYLVRVVMIRFFCLHLVVYWDTKEIVFYTAVLAVLGIRSYNVFFSYTNTSR